MKRAPRATCALATALAFCCAARAQEAGPWSDPAAVAQQLLVGQRVVTKYKVALHDHDRVVDDGSAFRVYTVDQAVGDKLRLTAGAVSGWVEAEQVVPFDEAVAFYTDEIRKRPFPFAAFNHRALIWMEKREYDFALADYDAAIRLNPGNATAYNNRGNVYREKREYDRALADYNQAIRLAPNVALHYANRARVYAAKRQFDKALADHDAAIALNPRLPASYLNRGHVWLAKKAFDKALADFDQALKLSPKLPGAYLGRGLAHAAKKEFDRALADCDEAVRLAPKFAPAYIDRGNVRRQKQQYAKALADFDEAMRLNPDFAVAHNNRAWLLATCPDASFRDGAAAVASARRACALEDWKNPTSLDTLAAAYAEQGDFAAAVEWQEKANAGLTDDTQRLEGTQRLALYREHKPYRE